VATVLKACNLHVRRVKMRALRGAVVRAAVTGLEKCAVQVSMCAEMCARGTVEQYRAQNRREKFGVKISDFLRAIMISGCVIL
jgi:hypothetical protein